MVEIFNCYDEKKFKAKDAKEEISSKLFVCFGNNIF